jgi:hypothetical protein
MQFALSGMQNRTFGPYLATTYEILIPVLASLFRPCDCLSARHQKPLCPWPCNRLSTRHQKLLPLAVFQTCTLHRPLQPRPLQTCRSVAFPLMRSNRVGGYMCGAQLFMSGKDGVMTARPFTFHGCLGPESRQQDVMKMCGIAQVRRVSSACMAKASISPVVPCSFSHCEQNAQK